MSVPGIRFILADKKSFPLKGTNGRFTHKATIHYGVREFMYFIDNLTGKTYIEELTGGSLSYISDDSLWQAIGTFLQEKGLTKILLPKLKELKYGR